MRICCMGSGRLRCGILQSLGGAEKRNIAGRNWAWAEGHRFWCSAREEEEGDVEGAAGTAGASEGVPRPSGSESAAGYREGRKAGVRVVWHREVRAKRVQGSHGVSSGTELIPQSSGRRHPVHRPVFYYYKITNLTVTTTATTIHTTIG